MNQQITVVRFTRETNQVLHDVFVLPTGRTYYRRNLGRFETEIPPGVGALAELRLCVRELKDQAVHLLKGDDLFDGMRQLRKRAETHRCSFATQPLQVDNSAL